MREPLPPWLHKPLVGNTFPIGQSVQRFGLCTVCEEASCPNLSECYHKKRATFLLLGPFCTRSCGFCGVRHCQQPLPPDPSEPEKVAACCQEFSLRHVVLTMVTRDDLEDGGASHLAATIRAVRSRLREATVEVLTSDFGGTWSAAEIVLKEHPEIFAHNVETVRSFSPLIRSKATFDGSLALLRQIKEHNSIQVTKSSLMVGLGEQFNEVIETLQELAAIGVSIVTIGQYLRPSAHQMAVKEWIKPEIFEEYSHAAKSMGFAQVLAGPFVRSSYGV